MVRVLFIGDVGGQVEKACHLVTKTKSDFDLCVCTGRFCARDMDLHEGRAKCPLYFIDAGEATQGLIEESPDGKTLGSGEDVNFLGHYGVKKIRGLTIAYLSGTYDAEKYESDTALFVDGHYTKLAIERLVEELELEQQVDILVTAEWPENLGRHLKMKKNVSSAGVSPLNSLIAMEPRYWLASADVRLGSTASDTNTSKANKAWKRKPWRHNRRSVVDGKTGETIHGVTRFIALPPMSEGPPAFHPETIDPDAKPTKEDYDEATPAPTEEEKAETSETKNCDEKIAWKPSFGMADGEERRRWKKMYGINPEDMSEAQDKMDKLKASSDTVESKKRVSLYKNQRPDKRKRGGGSNMTFQERERRAQNHQ